MKIHVTKHAQDRGRDRFGWDIKRIISAAESTSGLQFIGVGETFVGFDGAVAIVMEKVDDNNINVITLRMARRREKL